MADGQIDSRKDSLAADRLEGCLPARLAGRLVVWLGVGCNERQLDYLLVDKTSS